MTRTALPSPSSSLSSLPPIKAKKPIEVSVSKVWKVPPRPKPGRKPKSVIPDHHHNHPHPHRHTQQQHAPGSDCGLCEEGGSCMCDELGIRPKLDPTVPVDKAVMDFENFQPVKAVPLPKRAVGTAPGVSKLKFKRLAPRDTTESVVQHVSAPSEMLEGHSHQGGCGFCSNDTPCLCADTKSSRKAASTTTTVLPSLRSIAPMPPPLAYSAKSPVPVQSPSVMSPPVASTSQPAAPQVTNTPATCTKCHDDPMCSLFCTSLASLPQSLNKFPASISCKDAYTTLSRHGKFNDADLGEVVSRLESQHGKVSVGSVSKVLKYLNSVH